jgi:dethiobiotin synthetase
MEDAAAAVAADSGADDPTTMPTAATPVDSPVLLRLTAKELGNLRLCPPLRLLRDGETDRAAPAGGAAAAAAIGIVGIFGSWNRTQLMRSNHSHHNFLLWLARTTLVGFHGTVFAGTIEPDDAAVENNDDEDMLEHFLTHVVPPTSTTASRWMPQELPVVAVVVQTAHMDRSVVRYVVQRTGLTARDWMRAMMVPHDHSDNSQSVTSSIRLAALQPVRDVVEGMELEYNLKFGADDDDNESTAVRLFVAGDRSSVGKSSVCLGILGCLIRAGYAPETLAYIKPATQSESPQLIQRYCEQQGIHCQPIGPLVYYRGFTRAFLAGNTGTTAELLEQCGAAVDRISRGKRVVLVDGVGFPAVGSICGTSNAAVARACGYGNVDGRTPMGVVLVGGSGVGAAVDAFNLNAVYFESAGIPVLGGIFNKLPKTGYYSLENCREQVTQYFDQKYDEVQKDRRPFGFVPLFPYIAGNNGMDYVDRYFQIFDLHVDAQAIIDAAWRVKKSVASGCTPVDKGEVHGSNKPAVKRRNLSHSVRATRRREEIEHAAIQAGAAPSA